MTREKGFMSLETFKKSLTLAKELKVPALALHNWGESLLHPDIYKFVKLASQKFKVGFTTNGTLLNREVIEKLKKNHLTYLDISVNMHTETFRLIHLLVSYKIANTLGIDCRLRCVVSNYAEFDYLQYKLRDFKVRWQRQMVRTKRTQKCLAKEKVLVIQWDGTVVPCCAVINKEIIYGKVGGDIDTTLNELENEYCLRCGEVEETMPVKFKLS